MSLIERAQHFQQSNSVFHRMDPRAKLIVALLYSTTCPLVVNLWILAGLTAVSIVFMLMARLRKMLYITMGFSLIPFLVYVPVEAWLWNKNPDFITYGRLYLTVTPIMYCGMILGFTTSLDKMMAAFEKMRFPRPVRYGIQVALRYLVMLESEAGMLFKGLKARGLMPGRRDYFIQPVKTLRLLVIPMLIRSFKVADQMAAAAELKGVAAPVKPRKIQPLLFRAADLGFISLNLCLMVAAWAL